tara:strand:+ start:9133 stop:9801 length:669 start_codon:yes stop_codon:yes gene_type:complete
VIVAINTSFETASVGVGGADGLLGITESQWPAPLEVLLDQALGSACNNNGVDDDVDAVVVATGPGRFAALRGGMAFAKGFSFARGLPLLGVSSVSVVQRSVGRLDCVVVLPAGRNRWYFAEPNGDDAQLVSADMFGALLTKNHVVATADNCGLHMVLDDVVGQPLVVSGATALESMISMALCRLVENSGPALFGAEPVYIQPPTTAKPWVQASDQHKASTDD